MCYPEPPDPIKMSILIMKYEDRLAQAQALYNKPPKADQPGQKFPRGCRIKVCDEMPHHMRHFICGFEAIVQYTYAQQYGGDNIDSYSLIRLDAEGKAIDSTAWYKENQLKWL